MPFFVCVFVLGCTGLHAANASCRFLSSEVPQPCQAVTAPLSRQQEGAEWMCTSIIFFHSIRLLNLEQLGCVSSLWKTVPECLCLVTVEPPPPFQLFIQILQIQFCFLLIFLSSSSSHFQVDSRGLIINNFPDMLTFWLKYVLMDL